MDLNVLGTWHLMRILYLKATLLLWIKNLLKSMRTLANALSVMHWAQPNSTFCHYIYVRLGPLEGALSICI